MGIIANTITGEMAYPILKSKATQIKNFCQDAINELNAGGMAYTGFSIMESCHNHAAQLRSLLTAIDLDTVAQVQEKTSAYSAVAEYSALATMLESVRDAIYTRIPFSAAGHPETFNIVNYQLIPVNLPAAMRTAGVTALTDIVNFITTI